MVSIRNVDVQFMRVNASTGGAVGNDHDLLEEIRAALRDSRDDPTVVQAIQAENRRIVQAIENLGRQMSGVPGSGTGGGGGTAGAGGGAGHTGEDLEPVLTKIQEVIDRLERATVALEGGEKAGGGGSGNYFSREAQLRALSSTSRLFESLSFVNTKAEETGGVLGTFSSLVQRQVLASFENLVARFFTLGLHSANLGAAFRELHQNLNQQLVTMRESGVFGSNILTPGQFFLEGLTRIREGMLTTSDSFRSVVTMVGDALQHNFMSPLMTTGRAASELAQDMHEARNDLRERGIDTRAFMSTREANAHLASLLDLQMKFGVQSTIRDIRTELMMAQDQQYLRVIASMTGETVGKLSEQLRGQRQQAELLIGLGSLRNATEAQNFSSGQLALSKLTGGSAVGETVQRMLMGGREPGSIIAAMPEFATLAGSMPQMFNTLMQLQDAMLKKASPEQLYAVLARLTRSGDIQQFQNMPQVARQDLYGSMLPSITALVNAAQAAAAKPAQDAEQRRKAQENPIMALIQRATEIWQENIAPLFTLERALGGLTIAIGVNTAALLFAAGRMNGGLGGMLGMAGKFLGPVAGAAIAGGAAYAGGSSMGGVAGAAGGSMIGGVGGALLGSMAGPVGTMIGMAAGSALGGWLGQRFGETAVSMPRNLAGGQAGISFQQDPSDQILSQIVTAMTENNQISLNIHGELQSQTGYLRGGGGEPVPVRPAGQGLASGMPARSMLNRPDDSTPYVGP